MKKIFNIAVASLLALATLSSCDLNLFPRGSINYDENGALFVNATELGYFQTGLYSSYRSGFYGANAIICEVSCDGFNATADYGNNYGAPHRLDKTFDADDYDVRDFWANRYSAIKNYNVFIKGVETLPEEYSGLLEAAQVVKGEAYFFRASAYLDLVRHFAPAYNASTASKDLAVPLVLVYNQMEKPVRASVADIYGQIKKDLDSAAVNLAGVAGKIGSQKITIDAVNALYARYYLDVKDYGNAASYADQVIESAAGYALASTVDEFKAEYHEDKGKEPIIQLYASLAENGSGTNNVYTFMGTSASLKDADKNPLGRYFNKPYFLPSQKLLNLYDSSDLRLKCWFTAGENALTGETYSVLLGSDYSTDITVFTKYMGDPVLTNTDALNSRHNVKPLMIGEMYLIAAEAYYKGGNSTTGLARLQTLQGKRGSAPSGIINEDVLSNEWFKETVGEGLRLSTIKRFGKGYTVRTPQAAALSAKALTAGADFVGKSVSASDFHLVWPIPTNDIQTNPNLVQNPGY